MGGRVKVRGDLEAAFESESSINGSIPTAYWSACKLLRLKKRRFARLLQSPLTDSNRRPPYR
jgi:hypothetical protein